MAKLKAELPDDLLIKLSKLGKDTEKVTKKMLKAGGKVVLKSVKSELAAVIGSGLKFESRSTGELEAALGLSDAKLDNDGNYNVKVGFREPRRHQYSAKRGRNYYTITNKMIANVIEYGKHGQPPRPFMKRAQKLAKKPCIEAMTKVFDEEVKKL